jgi:translation initiation factor 3 subunit J
MAGQWDDEDSSTPPSSPPVAAVAPRRSRWDDEEDDNGDVAESWESAEEEEEAKLTKAEQEKKDAEARAAELAKNKKPKTQRIAERVAANKARKAAELEESSSEEDEDEALKRARDLQRSKEGDLEHARDLLGDIGISNRRVTSKPVTVQTPADVGATIDLSTLPLFRASTKDQFAQLRQTLVPLLVASSKKPHYPTFLQEFSRELVKELSSDQVKKIASGLTTLSNEKMKEEKAADKGGKKSKAAKTKTALVASRDEGKADTTNYANDDFDDDDFM